MPATKEQIENYLSESARIVQDMINTIGNMNLHDKSIPLLFDSGFNIVHLGIQLAIQYRLDYKKAPLQVMRKDLLSLKQDYDKHLKPIN